MENLKRTQLYIFVLLLLSFLMTMISYISYKHYLAEYSEKYVENFRLQNIDLIESNATLQLTQKFEFTKISNNNGCLLAKNASEVFYNYGECNCSSFNVFNYCISIKPAGNSKIEILFDLKLPTKLKISFFAFLLINVFLSGLSVALLLIYEKTKENNSLKIVEITKQVAHDIRSPLSALNIITSTLNDVPEEKRLLIRNSVQRINDIANDLLQKGKTSTSSTMATDTGNNTLNSKNEKTEYGNKATKQQDHKFLVSTIVDNIVSEKRIQFREKINVQINIDLKNSFGLFVKANPNELSRVISNLINNSVEALPNQSGNVDVSVLTYTDDANKVCIQIKDNGSGIPKHILAKLGQSGVTYGKENSQSGSGLGVYHATKTIQEFGGNIIYQSITAEDFANNTHNNGNIPSTGTTITIELPRAENPAWFASTINLTAGQEFVTVDDDISIHQIWKGRLESLKSKEQNIKLTSFTSAKEFREYFNKNSISSTVFLIDYEFLNQNDNGLKIITDLGIQDKAILVTSRFDEPNIRSECESHKIKILPKQLAGQIGISIMPRLDHSTFETTSQALPNELTDLEKSKESLKISNSMNSTNPVMPIQMGLFENTNLSKTEFTITNPPSSTELSKYDLCLIDDDKLLVHSIWGMVAKEKGLTIKMFEGSEDFLMEANRIDKTTPIYVDVSLGNNINGVDFARDIHRLGFENINLATGYDADSIKAPSFIRQVVGKDFPI